MIWGAHPYFRKHPNGEMLTLRRWYTSWDQNVPHGQNFGTDHVGLTADPLLFKWSDGGSLQKNKMQSWFNSKSWSIITTENHRETSTKKRKPSKVPSQHFHLALLISFCWINETRHSYSVSEDVSRSKRTLEMVIPCKTEGISFDLRAIWGAKRSNENLSTSIGNTSIKSRFS